MASLTRAPAPGGSGWLALATLALVLASGSAQAAPDGESIYMAQKCNTCHAVPAAGIEATVKIEKMKGPGLPTASLSQEVEQLSRLLRRGEPATGDKKHPKKFSGSEEELGALLGWLAQLPPQPADGATAD